MAHDLVGRGVNYFLPMSWRVRRHRGRKIRSLLPLFSGYLFFCGDENNRLEVLRTNRVANIIEVEDQQKLLGELTQIEHALKTGAALMSHRYVRAGQHCRVISGPLTDLQGIVVRAKNTMRLVLQIDMLGQATSVEVDADLIEVTDEPTS